MKKYLIGFGLVVIFFAGNGYAILEDAEWESGWVPTFSATTSYEDCKRGKEKGFWINTLDEGERCLSKEACKTLEVRYQIKETKIKLRRVVGDSNVITYFIAKEDDVDCSSNSGCVVAKETNHSVACYKSDEMKEEKKTDPKHCKLVNPEGVIIDLIPAIDLPDYAPYEWYCPNSWEGSYPSEKNPYNPGGDFFKDSLGNVYNYSPDEDELKRFCALRMFALSKSCVEILGKKSVRLRDIENIRRDFLARKAENIWRLPHNQGMIKSKNNKAERKKAIKRWEKVRDMSFADICNVKVDVKCDDAVWKEEKDNIKAGAIEDIQDWLKSSPNNKHSSSTPRKYVKQKAHDAWYGVVNDPKPARVAKVTSVLTTGPDPVYKGDTLIDLGWEGGEEAKKKYGILVEEARNTEELAESVYRYISRRNSDLNISVAIGQTKGVEVSKYLRVSNNSREADLSAFSDGEGKINIFDKIIRLAIGVMGTLAILLLIISGVLMIASQGDENQLAKAKTTFIYTLIGLVVGFLSYTIVRFFIDTLLS